MGPTVPLTDGAPLLRGSCCPLTPLMPPLLLPPLVDTDTGVPATEWARRCTIPDTTAAELGLGAPTLLLHDDGVVDPGVPVDTVVAVAGDGSAGVAFALPPS